MAPPVRPRLDPRDLAVVAAAAADLSAFAGEVLDRCERVIGFDVAYHAAVSDEPAFAARRGLTDTRARRMLERSVDYSTEMMPVKRAAYANGGVAIDSQVFTAEHRSRLSYFVEMMAPDGGRHALIALGLVGARVVSVTLLGRTGSCFSHADVSAIQGIVPVLGLATAAHRSTQAPSGTPSASRLGAPLAPMGAPLAPMGAPLAPMSARERDLVDYVALGLTNSEIGLALGTSPHTVRNQLSVLYARVGVANRAELVALLGSRERDRA